MSSNINNYLGWIEQTLNSRRSPPETEVFLSITIMNSILKTVGSTYASNEEINRHALPITASKLGGGFDFQSVFLQMFHRRFANNAPQALLCKSNW